MARLEKLVELFLTKPPQASFEDVVKLLEAFGYQGRPSKTGRRVFVKPSEYPVTVPTVKGRRVKQVYVSKIVERSFKTVGMA
jgi:predicted RNA binding protein YcfA (HicA-like mRNA interferase family)